MNRRKAKKQVKKKWRIRRWNGNDTPREVNAVCAYVAQELTKAFCEAIDRAILYGSGDGGLHIMPQGITRRFGE